jgi:beta-lactamase regulating signal transducer with metallopeptidase domain/regulation of enolase protein 1 (concanavalin A-like superfamily)
MTTTLALLLIERLGWVLMHSLWQFMAIALVVRLFERTFVGRRGTSLRYAAGMCGLAAITVAPVATWFLIPAVPAPDAGAVSAVPFDDNLAERRVVPSAALRLGQEADAVESAVRPRAWYSLSDTWSEARATLALRLRPWLPMLVVGWSVGLSLCSLRPLVGWLTLRRLRTIGVSAPGQELTASAQRIAVRLGMTQALTVWQSTVTKTPLVVGYLRPALLLPVAMLAELPPAELEAILAHELAHVRRHDFLVNLWQTLLETVFYYHPAVWSLSHRLRAEREHCCDDVALSIVGDPVRYGRALLHVEELRGAASLLAFGAGGGSLRERIVRLFDQSSRPVSPAGLFAGALLPSVTLVILFLAFAEGALLNGGEQEQAAVADQADEAKSLASELAQAVGPAPVAGSWTVIDPDKDCEVRLVGENLSISVPPTSHDLNAVRGMNAPRVLKKVSGDFVIQVKLVGEFKPGTISTGKGRPFNGAGILLWQSEKNYLRVERNAFWSGETLYCYPPIMEYWHDGKYSGANEDLVEAGYFKGQTTWLKVNRQGKNVTVSISHDGKEWTDVKTFPVELGDELSVGVDALNTSDKTFTVDFEELMIQSK